MEKETLQRQPGLQLVLGEPIGGCVTRSPSAPDTQSVSGYSPRIEHFGSVAQAVATLAFSCGHPCSIPCGSAMSHLDYLHLPKLTSNGSLGSKPQGKALQAHSPDTPRKKLGWRGTSDSGGAGLWQGLGQLLRAARAQGSSPRQVGRCMGLGWLLWPWGGAQASSGPCGGGASGRRDGAGG